MDRNDNDSSSTKLGEPLAEAALNAMKSKNGKLALLAALIGILGGLTVGGIRDFMGVVVEFWFVFVIALGLGFLFWVMSYILAQHRMTIDEFKDLKKEHKELRDEHANCSSTIKVLYQIARHATRSDDDLPDEEAFINGEYDREDLLRVFEKRREVSAVTKSTQKRRGTDVKDDRRGGDDRRQTPRPPRPRKNDDHED